ncbi:hypothetical protein [Pseudomonas serbica]|uniref:hypothetical protein n=1 Tax=Pseudomonas serbica TaxID=2965074 RepID=UPI00237AD85F|nr:hypothetical protein [Pseudomonas serbica]
MDKTKVLTETLAGEALNWAVMKSEGVELTPVFKESGFHAWYIADAGMPRARGELQDFAGDWNLMKGLVLKHDIGFGKIRGNRWAAHPMRSNEPTNWSYADDPAVAVCRAAVIETLGTWVEVPTFLVEQPVQGLKSV